MSTHPLYLRIQSSLSSYAEHSLCLHTSSDRVHFDSYPSSNFTYSTSTLATVLPDLRTHFVVQASGPFIRATIDSAPWPQDEIDLESGYSVQVVENATQLAYAADCCQSVAFVRADCSLVIWADHEDIILSSWSDIIYRLQNRFESALLCSTQMAGPPGYSNTLNEDIDRFFRPDLIPSITDRLQGEGSLRLSGDTLPSLTEFSFLATVHGSMTPSPPLDPPPSDLYPHLHPLWPWVQRESPNIRGLQLALQFLSTSSPSSDHLSSSFMGTPSTINLASISPPPVGIASLIAEEDTPSNTSLDFATPTSDGVTSPISSMGSHSPIMQHPASSTRAGAIGPPSFRRHSVGETSAPRAVGRKTKRNRNLSDDNEDDDYDKDDDDNYVLHVNNETISASLVMATVQAATADSTTVTTAGRPAVLGDAHASKRRRSITKVTSAPARFTIPLPIVENVYDYDEGFIFSMSSSISTSTSTSTSTPSPTPTPAPAPAEATTRAQRKNARGRVSLSSSRTKRTRCDFCSKTFSRPQDAQRHMATSCAASPEKAGVECPECDAVLSRLDAAQRHWRSHENPTCEPPSWAHRP
ncbi:hypothetical protein B0F90DRAFT_1735309 [Multifurca ochricompacta]|uniref:C2H2-type domain-containing protein n=1 Tax=Multifurca ochricompacta TaxID=376703 RepID=A0AAD4M0X7_9AGAM|nr:hypothetical protein B0F90DRAFT_1735309 [Multifurca ochricompacta]